MLVPFLYLFLNSVKIEREFRSIPLRIIPSVITLQYYADIFGRGGRLDMYLLNSVVVTFAVVVVSVFTGAVAAFGLAKPRMYRFIALGVYLILLVRFYPKVVMLIPYFILMRDLHLLDTLAAVVIAHSSIGVRSWSGS